MKGFTLIEVIVSLALFIVLLGLFLPVALSYLSASHLADTTTGVQSALREAQAKAKWQKNDQSFGVKFLSDTYVLFQGESYASRDESEDLIFGLPAGVTTSCESEWVFDSQTSRPPPALPAGVTTSCESEWVFTSQTGRPTAVGSITITAGTRSETIEINKLGLIETL
ncbi:MAG: hypothetical protein A2589_01625 [Candidatus Vogelbacteria bacterium RIFOXYD1_FULL_46_19]|uniref:General secretion pathway GspH domain-containing protein n=1 Tax=Candidatus Vogelbacteria bacterium RIFOXYD1_FULL_46_19 TaxID=1802439 RepID=A0A1G2QGQ6_9BACT|nr:MAG: hypothetical protein A2589_01625 [Candidatus Vogelbacteria bacterium RIFOXYD1_FULL_46_19]